MICCSAQNHGFLVWLLLALFPFVTALELVGSDFDWHLAPCEEYLQYTPCSPDLQCAQLKLPFDYWNGSTNATLCLAVIKKPVRVDVARPKYGGAILINPAGPGISGVESIRNGWLVMEMKFGPFGAPSTIDFNSNLKFFDIISFNQRGLGYTTPVLPSLPDAIETAEWGDLALTDDPVTIVGSSDDALDHLWNTIGTKSRSSSLQSPDEDDLRPFVSSRYTARDLLEIVERHGVWRKKEAKRIHQAILSSLSNYLGYCPAHKTYPKAVPYDPGAEKLLSSSGSYGSIVGLTFASMYADCVHHMVLDGVSNAFSRRRGWDRPEVAEAGIAMQLFYSENAKSGWPACALASRDEDGSAAVIEAWVSKILNTLQHSGDFYTYSMARSKIMEALYHPMTFFRSLAQALVKWEAGVDDQLLNLAGMFDKSKQPPRQHEATNLFEVSTYGEPYRAIDKCKG